MTDKITLGDVTSFTNDTSATTIVNSNSAIIETAFNNTLSRDGTTPNQMGANLDMNSFHILNLPPPATSEEPLRLTDLSSFIGGGTVSNIPAGGSINQVLTKTGPADYVFNWEPIATNTIANSMLVQAGAFTLKGNPTGSTANEADFTLPSLTNKSPASTDLILIADQAASGALKTATVSSIGTASGISSIDTLTGVFTTSNGITSTGNSIQMTSARRTLPTRQVFTTATSGTYTTPTNCLYIKVTAVGGGGGGGGANNGASGGLGGNTTFSTFTAGGGGQGSSGTSSAVGGPGGTSSGGSLNISGQSGGSVLNTGLAAPFSGGTGGGSAFLGGGGPLSFGGGISGVSNTGGGGTGGSVPGATCPGAGGGGGGSLIGWINSPTTTYSYVVGAGGAGGAGNGGANGGGNGGTGIIIVEEFYNS